MDQEYTELVGQLEKARRIAIELEQQNGEVLRLLHVAENHGYTGVQAARSVKKALDVLKGQS
jgi:hypothetical protein